MVLPFFHQSNLMFDMRMLLLDLLNCGRFDSTWEIRKVKKNYHKRKGSSKKELPFFMPVREVKQL